MSEPTAHQETPNVLIVDDMPANLQLLTAMLKERGFKARIALNGKLALQATRNEPPDLILLDINMPEMNGYEVCERLKADEKLREIPVIFISAMSDSIDKVRAFGVGGVDYLSKPFQIEEVEARIQAHLQLHRQRLELRQSNARLRRLEELRDSLVHMIVHDMRNLLLAISGYLELLSVYEAESITPEGGEYVRKARAATSKLIEMISSILDVSKMEADAMKLKLSTFELVALAKGVQSDTQAIPGRAQLALDAPSGPVEVTADADLVLRVLHNLVGNAVRFTPSDGWVRVGIEPDGDRVRVTVRDSGRGIPPEDLPRIFDKYGIAEAHTGGRNYSTGLGLAFCKLAVEAHGGSIGVESQVGEGSTFWFDLPLPGPQAPAADSIRGRSSISLVPAPAA